MEQLDTGAAEELPVRSITSVQLKWIAVITMLIDHIGASLIEWKMRYTISSDHGFYAMLRSSDRLIRSIGRIAFPLYIFLLVEGFFHTRSRKKYFGRLLLFAAISEFPFDLAFFLQEKQINANIWWRLDHQNVFFTLVIGFAVIWLIETLRPKTAEEALWRRIGRVLLCMVIVVAGCRLAKWMHTDYQWSGVLAITLGYLIRLAGLGQFAMFGILTPLIVYSSLEIVAVVDLLLTGRYFGEKGHTRMGRWFFYAFYPCHLLLLGILRVLFILPH